MTVNASEEQRRREARREYSRRYYQANKEKIRKQQNAWRRENPEKVERYYREFYDRRAREYEEEGEG